MQVGPWEATSITRKGNTLTFELTIPADASLGVLLDCHIEFDPGNTGRPIVFKGNGLFRVVE